MKISSHDLKYVDGEDWFRILGSGYRIVFYFDDGTYKIGPYAKRVEDFMIGFYEKDEINKNMNLENFITIDELLETYLENFPAVEAVELYSTEGLRYGRKVRNDEISLKK